MEAISIIFFIHNVTILDVFLKYICAWVHIYPCCVAADQKLKRTVCRRKKDEGCLASYYNAKIGYSTFVVFGRHKASKTFDAIGNYLIENFRDSGKEVGSCFDKQT